MGKGQGNRPEVVEIQMIGRAEHGLPARVSETRELRLCELEAGTSKKKARVHRQGHFRGWGLDGGMSVPVAEDKQSSLEFQYVLKKQPSVDEVDAWESEPGDFHAKQAVAAVVGVAGRSLLRPSPD